MIRNPTEFAMLLYRCTICFKSISPWIKHLLALSRSRSSFWTALQDAAPPKSVCRGTLWHHGVMRQTGLKIGAFRSHSWMPSLSFGWYAIQHFRAYHGDDEGMDGSHNQLLAGIHRDPEAVLPAGLSVCTCILRIIHFQGHFRCTQCAH